MPRGASSEVRIAIIGAGKVSDYHHVPGIALDRRARLVGVCDANEALARERCAAWGAAWALGNPLEAVARDDVDAVIIATPNDTHASIAIAAARAGKHVLCEKPLGLDADEVETMLRAARDARVVHMTAFTYRFAPGFRYLERLVRTGALGTPRHFRSQRFLDLPETSWGWRQYRARAGAGNLFDMMIHRIDLGLDLCGPLQRICGALARFTPRDRTDDGRPVPPSDIDDWSAMIGEFASGAVGVWEGTTVGKGYGLGGFGHEWAEVNGSEGTAVYRLHLPNSILLGATGRDLEETAVPRDLLTAPGSPRDPSAGAPATVFRYDVVWEFVSAIVDGRPAVPSFADGFSAQRVADAVIRSHAEGVWVDIPPQKMVEEVR